MKQDVLPGRYTETWFRATKLGSFHLFCAEYCGSEHSRMTGRIVVVSQDDYGRWLAAQPQGDGLAKEGEAIFRARGCSGCHAEASKVHAPKLRGLYGRAVQLADGRTVTADDAYLRDSMLLPKRDITAGFEPIMPSYKGILTDGEIISLTAYIRSLVDESGGHAMTATTISDELPLPRDPSYLGAGHTVASWIATTDHKRIAILYAATITFFFFLGGIAIALVRLELFTPAGDFLSDDTYNKLFTFHGVMMVWFFLVPSIPATFGNFLLPLMIGAR